MSLGRWRRGAGVLVLVAGLACVARARADAGTGAISGRVVTDGLPACVLVLDAGGQSVASGPTGSDGSYTLSGVPAGSWAVEFYPDGGCIGAETDQAFQFYAGASTPATASPVRVSVGATTGSIDATLAPASSITGTVRTQGLEPVENVCAVLEDTAGRAVVRQPSDARGDYVLDRLPHGHYVVQFVDDGCAGRAARYVTSFYPGASSLARALVLTLGVGQDLTGVDVTLDARTASPTPTPSPSPSPPPDEPAAKKPAATHHRSPRPASIALVAEPGRRWTVDGHHRLVLRLRCAAHRPGCRAAVRVKRTRRAHGRLVTAGTAGRRTVAVRAGRTARVLVPLRHATSGRLWIGVRLAGRHALAVNRVVAVRWPRRHR